MVLFQAMHFISSAWDQVTPETIMKCFRKSGIAEEAAEYSDDDSLSDAEDEPGDHRPAQSVEEPQSWNVVSNGMTFQDFVSCDDSVAVAGENSLDDLIGDVAGGEESEEEEEIDPANEEPIPSFVEALSGHEAAKRYLCSKAIDEKEVNVVSAFGRILYKSHFAVQKQSSLEDFFRS